MKRLFDVVCAFFGLLILWPLLLLVALAIPISAWAGDDFPAEGILIIPEGGPP